MKQLVLVSTLLFCCTGTALAGSGYDACLKEEKELRAKEAGSCSGLSYLLNPSPCYVAQRSLREYKGGKCREIGIAEGVDFTASPAVPERAAPPTPVSEPKRMTTPEPRRAPVVREVPQTAPPQPPATREELLAENTRLRAEVLRLTNELEQLKRGR